MIRSMLTLAALGPALRSSAKSAAPRPGHEGDVPLVISDSDRPAPRPDSHIFPLDEASRHCRARARRSRPPPETPRRDRALMRGGVGLHIADIAVRFGLLPADISDMSVSQSTSERRSVSARRCRREPRREMPAGQMPRIRPASIPAPWPPRLLAVVEVGSGLPPSAQTSRSIIASARSAHDTVHRRHDHDTVRRDPHRIDLVHPIVGLTERIIRVTTAGPVA